MKRSISLLNVVLVISLLVGGCTTPAPEVIEKTVTPLEVEKEVTKAVEVEKVVTATPAPKSIKIGFLGPLTGGLAILGESSMDGILMAVDEWNARGGVLGRPIELVSGDTQCDGEAAYHMADRIILDEEVKFIVGAICPSASIPISEIANANEVVMISPNSTNPTVTINSDGSNKEYVFRVCFLDDFQAMAGAKFAIEGLGANRAAVLYDVDNEHAMWLATLFRDAFFELGGEVTVFEAYSSSVADFTDLLARVAETNADVLFCPDYPSEANRIGAQAQEMGLGVLIIGSDVWQMANLDTEVLDGSYFSAHYSPDDPRLLVSEYLDAFEEKFGREPDLWAVLAYDAANAMLMAIKEAGTDDPEAVKDTLSELAFEGVSGVTKFDEHGDPIKEVTIHRVDKDEGPEWVEASREMITVSPETDLVSIFGPVLNYNTGEELTSVNIEIRTAKDSQLLHKTYSQGDGFMVDFDPAEVFQDRLVLRFSHEGYVDTTRFVDVHGPEDYPVVVEMVPVNRTTVEVGPGGSESEEVNGVTLVFPEGAVTKPARFEVTVLPPEAVPEDVSGVIFPTLAAVDIRPHAELNEAVTITFPLDKEIIDEYGLSDGDVLVISEYNYETGEFADEALAWIRNDGTEAVARVNHFSTKLVSVKLVKFDDETLSGTVRWTVKKIIKGSEDLLDYKGPLKGRAERSHWDIFHDSDIPKLAIRTWSAMPDEQTIKVSEKCATEESISNGLTKSEGLMKELAIKTAAELKIPIKTLGLNLKGELSWARTEATNTTQEEMAKKIKKKVLAIDSPLITVPCWEGKHAVVPSWKLVRYDTYELRLQARQIARMSRAEWEKAFKQWLLDKDGRWGKEEQKRWETRTQVANWVASKVIPVPVPNSPRIIGPFPRTWNGGAYPQKCAPKPPKVVKFNAQPPKVVRFNPTQGAGRISPDTTVVSLTFSEAMNQESVKNNFRIEPEHHVTLNWVSPMKVIVEFRYGMRDHTEYMITLGEKTESKTGKRLMRPFLLTFETGAPSL